MAGPAKKAGIATSKSVSMGPNPMSARISIPKGEITPIAQPSTGNAHGYIAGMAAQAHGTPARPGYSRPIVPKT
jgi:hypothetical protein